MALMTLEEKAGQLVQVDFRSASPADPVTLHPDLERRIREGRIGSVMNAVGADLTRRIQAFAVQGSRRKIPLVFGLDVIHGFRTVFPIPLGEASTWDPELIMKASRVAALEAAAAGIHWTFAPMVDIARDPRWGRIAEGAGEDPYLGSLMAAARVRGFQGDTLASPNSLMACAKHFAAYGGAEGGRDYNTVDISERTLRETYLPPFEAAVKAGVGTVMCSFNEIGGIPCAANEHLLREILRQEWGFDGFVVSDWDAIPEMQPHGFAGSPEEAAYLALRAGVDMDMEGGAYEAHLVSLVRSGRLPEETLDSAVRHVLRAKFALGLFDDPYHGASADRERRAILAPSHRALAREVAGKSLVLLKNAGGLLPLRKDLQSVAVIGPLADDGESILGPWSGAGRSADAVPVLEGIRRKVAASTKILYARGCGVADTSTSSFSGALAAAAGADAVVMVVGEESGMSGEAASRSTLGLPGVQEQLFEAVLRLHKPLVVVLMNGRPLAIPRLQEAAPAILEAWFPGVEGGDAVADVLFGDRDPSGKITATFPFSVGQVPLYYNHKNTGRPTIDTVKYTSRYLDGPTSPLYPFGYGLHYTSFAYQSLKLGATRIRKSEGLRVSVDLHNTGSRAGEETVQLYIRDLSGSVTHPVKELKAFRKVRVEPGRTENVQFQLTPESLALYDRGMRKVVEPGLFEVMVGGNSKDLLTATLEVTAE